MTKLCPLNVLVPKWHLAYFCQLMASLAKLLDMDFKFVLPSIYINFDIQTNFEVNRYAKEHPVKLKKSVNKPQCFIWILREIQVNSF